MIRSFTIEFEHLNQYGCEVIFAKTKVEAIKIFLKPINKSLTIIKNITDNGHLPTYKRNPFAYGRIGAY